MVYGDFKDLTKRTASDKILRDKAFNIAKNLKYDGYQKGLASMVCKFFEKKKNFRCHYTCMIRDLMVGDLSHANYAK